MTTRIEFNCATGERTEVPLTQAELDAAASLKAAWDAEHTLDACAARAIGRMDRLQFEHLFALENDLRDARAKVNAEAVAAGRPAPYTAAQAAQITVEQYRQALINRWKALNAV